MRPRLTNKVIRGLALVGQAARASSSLAGVPVNPASDTGSALTWIEAMNAWIITPRRKGPVPKQFRRRRRK